MPELNMLPKIADWMRMQCYKTYKKMEGIGAIKEIQLALPHIYLVKT